MKEQQPKFSSLSPKWQALVRRMQRLNFGYLHNLSVVDEEPEMLGEFVSSACYRFPGENGPRPEFQLKDFTLPGELLEFINTLKSLSPIQVFKVQICRGLPVQMEVDDRG